jgi:uncharacterized protein (TIRG00374 family)
MLFQIKKYKTSVMPALRSIVGIGFAIFLIHGTLKITGGDPWKAISEGRHNLLLLAILILGINSFITSFRWNLLLRVQGVYLRILDTFRLTLIGAFFSLVLPGSVSGDIIKMSYVTQHTNEKKMEAVLTVFLDRILGLFGLFILASFVVLFSLTFLLNLDKNYRYIQVAVFTIGIAGIAGMVLIILVELRKTLLRFSFVSWIVNNVGKKLPEKFISKLSRLILALELYRRNRRTVTAAIALSIMVHAFLAIILFLIGASVGENVLGLGDYFLASLVGNTVAAVPLTPAGTGTRDATIAIFLRAMEAPVDIAGVVPVIMTLIFIFWGLIGGIIFIFSKFPTPESGNYRNTK